MELNTILTDCWYSFCRVLVSSLIAWLMSIVCGFLLHRFRKLYCIFLPVINFFRQISPFVWLPFAIIFIGLGELPIGIVLFVAMFFPSVVMVFESIESFPKDIYEEAITSGAGSLEMFFKIEMPILRNQFVNIYRLLWSVGWSTVIAAEMLGVSQGLGFRLLDFRYLLEHQSMLIYILIIGGIGVLSDRMIRRLFVSYN